MRLRTKILLIIFGVFSAFMLMEVILFCSSFCLTNLSKKSVIDQGQEHALNVLCLGDSFTYGIGADFKQSFPAQLEQILRRKLDKNVIVINGGIPSENSAIVLAKLKIFLKYIQPDIIVVTVGRNDSWNYKQLNHSLNWKIKLKAFLSQSRVNNLFIITQINIKNIVSKNYLKQFVGKKNYFKNNLDFNEGLLIKANELRDARLFNKAILAYKKIIKAYPNNSRTLLELGRCYKLDGQENKAISVLMKALLAEEYDSDIFKELTSIFVEGKRLKQKMDVFYKLSIIFPENHEIKKLLVDGNMQLADRYYRLGDNDKVIVYYNKAMCLDPENQQIYNRVYYNKAMELDKNQNKLVNNKEKEEGQIVWQITFDNIAQIAEICKQQGIMLILSGYPEEVYNPVITAAKDYNVVFVDHRKDFVDKQVEGERNKYLIPDGHCTQWGYGIMAENIAEVIVSLLK